MSQTNNQPEPITSFSDFIDSITNKLTVYGIFNALLIFSLNLDKGIAQKFLVGSCLLLNFLLLILIIHFSCKKCKPNYDKASEAMYFGFFIIFIIGAFVGLVIYYIPRFPYILELIVSVLILYTTCIIVNQIFKFIGRFISVKISGIWIMIIGILIFLLTVPFYLSAVFKQLQALINSGN